MISPSRYYKFEGDSRCITRGDCGEIYKGEGGVGGLFKLYVSDWLQYCQLPERERFQQNSLDPKWIQESQNIRTIAELPPKLKVLIYLDALEDYSGDRKGYYNRRRIEEDPVYIDMVMNSIRDSMHPMPLYPSAVPVTAYKNVRVSSSPNVNLDNIFEAFIDMLNVEISKCQKCPFTHAQVNGIEDALFSKTSLLREQKTSLSLLMLLYMMNNQGGDTFKIPGEGGYRIGSKLFLINKIISYLNSLPSKPSIEAVVDPYANNNTGSFVSNGGFKNREKF